MGEHTRFSRVSLSTSREDALFQAFPRRGVALAAAHPGEVHDARALKLEIRARDAYAVAARRALDSRASTAEAQQLRQSKGIMSSRLVS